MIAVDLESLNVKDQQTSTDSAKKTSSEVLLEGVNKLKEIAEETQHQHISTEDNGKRNIMKDAFAKDKFELEIEKKAPVVPKIVIEDMDAGDVKPDSNRRGVKQKRPKPADSDQLDDPKAKKLKVKDNSQLRDNANNAGDALKAAAIADKDADSRTLLLDDNRKAFSATLKRNKKRAKRTAASAKYNADGSVQLQIGNIQFNTNNGNAKEAVKDIAESLKQQPKTDFLTVIDDDDEHFSTLGRGTDNNRNAEIDLGDGEKVNAQEAEAILKGIMEGDDAELTRLIALDMEALQLEMHELQTIKIDLNDEIEDYFKKSKLNFDDWEIKPSNNPDELSIVFKGKGELPEGEKVRKFSVPEEIKSRLATSKAQIDKLVNINKNSLPKRLAKVGNLLQSKGFANAAKGMKVVGNILTTVNFYKLATEEHELKNLATIHQAAFAVNAVDTVVDMAANTIGVVNKVTKIVNQGLNNPLIKIASHSFGQASAGIGVLAGVFTTSSSIFALTEAETQYELDVAITNTVFSSTSLTLSLVALAVPAAAPVIAVIGLVLAGLQALVLRILEEKERWRQAQETLDKRFEAVEELLKFVEELALIEIESAKVETINGSTTITITSQAESKRIVINNNLIKLHHGTNAYSVSLLNNQNYRYIRDTHGGGRPSVAYEFCLDDKDCIINVANRENKESLIQSGAKVSDDGSVKMRSQSVLFRPDFTKERPPRDFKAKKFLLEQRANNAVIPCLLLNRFSLEDIREQLFNFIIEQRRYSSNGNVKTIIINEVYPRIMLRSSTSRYLENSYEANLHTKHERIQAITKNVCEPKYHKQGYKDVLRSFYQSLRDYEENFDERNVPTLSDPSMEWEDKAYMVLAPAIKENEKWKTDNRTILIGEDYFLIERGKKQDEFDFFQAKIRYLEGNVAQARQQGLSGPENAYVTTVIDQVILEQQSEQEYDIDLTNTELVQLVLLPEKHASNIFLKLQDHFVFENTKDNSSSRLKIHADTYKKITGFPIYKINLRANQDTNLIIGFGTRTRIIEKNGKGKKRSGEINLDILPTFTQKDQNNTIKDINAKLARLQKDIEKIQKILRNNGYLDHEDWRGGKNVWRYFGDPETPKSRSDFERELAVKNATVEDMKRLKEIIQNRVVENFEQLKTHVELNTDENNQHQLYMIFNPKEINNEVERLTQAKLVIDDLQRKVTFIYPEAYYMKIQTADLSIMIKVTINIVYHVKITENKLKFNVSHFQNQKAEDIKNLVRENMFKNFWQQLMNNNPQLEKEIPKQIVCRDVMLNEGLYELVAGTKSEPYTTFTKKNFSFKTVPLESADLYTGYITIIDANTNNPNQINVFYKKSLSEEIQHIMQNLQFIGTEKITHLSQVPLEYQSICRSFSEEDRLIYFFYDPQSKTIAYQYMNMAIKPDYMSRCGPQELPGRFAASKSWKASEYFYTCVSPEQMELSSEIQNYKSIFNQQEGFFNYLGRIQKAAELPEIILSNNDYIDEKNAVWPLLMKYSNDEKPSALLIPSEFNLPELARSNKEGYVVFGEKVKEPIQLVKRRLEKINQKRKEKGKPELFELKILLTKLVQEKELKELETHLLKDCNEKAPIPEKFVPKPIPISEDLHIVLISENKQGLILATSDGILFSLSADFTERRLVGVDNLYFEENKIDLKDPIAVIKAYKNLITRFGKPDAAYLRIGESALASHQVSHRSKRDLSDEHTLIVFIDTLNEKPLYIPANSLITEDAMLVGELEINNHPAFLTLLDPRSRTLTQMVKLPLS